VFTGIVERPCPVVEARPQGGLRRLVLDLTGLEADEPGAPPVRPGDSVAVNGVCLTVADLDGSRASFDVVPETLSRTNLGAAEPGGAVNVERSLRFGQRVDGHLVQGHVETTGVVDRVETQPGEVRLTVRCEPAFARGTLLKGSVTLDGVSLTVAELTEDTFTVALVPHTLERTTLGARRPDDRVNLEPDVIGAWVRRVVEDLWTAAGPPA